MRFRLWLLRCSGYSLQLRASGGALSVGCSVGGSTGNFSIDSTAVLECLPIFAFEAHDYSAASEFILASGFR